MKYRGDELVCLECGLETGRMLYTIHLSFLRIDIRILNDKKLITHNMQEFLTAGAFYLREGAKEDSYAR